MSSVYFVAVVANPAAVWDKAVARYAEDALFKLSTDKFFVHTDETSLDVSKHLGIRDGSAGTGIVLRVTTYNGRANSALWEWLSIRV